MMEHNHQDRLIDCLSSWGADTAAALERVVGDRELYAECLLLFAADENLAALDAAMSEGRPEDAFRAVHALKGVAGNLGLTPLYEPLCRLTDALRGGAMPKDMSLYSEARRVFSYYIDLCGIEAHGKGEGA